MREVIDFWRAVEMFSPPSIPAVRASQLVFDLTVGGPLPWDPDHPIHRRKLTKHQTWRHTVYAGAFPRRAVFETLAPVLPPPPPGSYEERPGGDSALLAFAVSDEGFLLEDSAVISECAWAMARTLSTGRESPQWLSGFDGEEAEFRVRLEQAFIPYEDEVPKPVTLDRQALVRCRDLAVDGLGVDKGFPAKGIRISSEIVGRAAADASEHDFLNSLIADDLARVAGAVGDGHAGSALRSYLRPDAELDLARRIDVRAELDEVRRVTGPDRVPLGRWPSEPDRPLALGQQIAVNEAVTMANGDDHIFAVNGPPGTGKTMMLRDLIAALVTERAERLATLADPSDAFLDDDPHRWETKSLRRTVRRLRPELTGFEMVVASSNNAAVENVTAEIPAVAALGPSWREKAREQDDLRVLAELASGPDAWALIAARLGKRKNRRKFVNAVWWTEDPDDEECPPGLRALLEDWRDDRDPRPWAEAVEAFGRAHRRATSIRDDRRGVAAALDRLRELEPRLAAAREAERIARDRVIASRPRRDELVAESRRCEDEKCRLTEERREDPRPFILRFVARAAWRERDRGYASDLAATEERSRQAAADLRPLEAEADAYDEARAAVEPLAAEVEGLRHVVVTYRERAGAVVPDERWLEDRRERELRAPWSDEEWNEARTELFLAALALHRAFLVSAAKEMRGALAGAMDIIYGDAPPDLDGAAAVAAWQAFFLLVPVVSTTFASLGRMFDRLGPEALGWLLIDEAGQATPQAALGGLWRCRRAVVVGDPLQLEPITTIPFQLEQAIREHFGVAEEWLTGRGSTQGRADRLNRFGTTLAGDQQSVWVGAPLAVHRRCDHPMFDLSNRIAYDGLMIDATDPALAARFAADYPTLPPANGSTSTPGSPLVTGCPPRDRR